MNTLLKFVHRNQLFLSIQWLVMYYWLWIWCANVEVEVHTLVKFHLNPQATPKTLHFVKQVDLVTIFVYWQLTNNWIHLTINHVQLLTGFTKTIEIDQHSKMHTGPSLSSQSSDLFCARIELLICWLSSWPFA